MKRLSDRALEILNELHRERLDYNSEYLPLADALNRLSEYEDLNRTPHEAAALVTRGIVEQLFDETFAHVVNQSTDAMTLDEAITHARDVAEGRNPRIDKCSACATQHGQLADWLEELRIYQQFRGAGRMVVLPCAEGEIVYCFEPQMCNGRNQDVCTSYCDGYDLRCEDYEGKMEIRPRGFALAMFGEIGKTVFLTREEAEAALAKEEAK